MELKSVLLNANTINAANKRKYNKERCMDFDNERRIIEMKEEKCPGRTR
jgi:hypothetical protein